ncbi:nucleotide kinase domain-containing protein [Thomasclavelia cocleata]|uniref:nucleotide kinase domain-containing protein n=1 Tax=Thomasclavelia cocleata TaxID=69824 RepID=UPI00242E29CD|nr:nucleotide kinase domain-containing protein [Thomasclavelia cocleata]
MNLEELQPTPVYDIYWEFAVKRQEIFFAKMKDEKGPWTNDPILQQYKFTNAYRASDRVSQYLIRNVIYCNDSFNQEDVCFRILLFKLFNKIETWEYLEEKLGRISYSTYDYKMYDKFLNKKIDNGERIYSAAYIMPSGVSVFGCNKKHQNNLKLLECMMADNITMKIINATSLEELYNILLSYPTIGPFLAYQFSIDLNYSELCNFDESSFVVAGPGAKNGICKCFNNLGKVSYEDIIKFMANRQELEFKKRGLNFKTLFGRKLQLIDCQNLFCEVDKYSRVAYPQIVGLNSRNRIKQQYSNKNLPKIVYFYPPKWEINDKIGN